MTAVVRPNLLNVLVHPATMGVGSFQLTDLNHSAEFSSDLLESFQ